MRAKKSGLLGWARRRARALPPIAWRDQKIAELSRSQRDRVREIKAAEERAATVPSFRRYVYAERRLAARMLEIDRSDRGTAVTKKLRSYSFARSWGVDVPEIFGIWDRVEDIAWDELPDTVVIKSEGGAYARGVLPLRRVAGGWSIITDGSVLTPADIVERFRQKQNDGTVKGPFIAERFLGDADRELMPHDVKFYSFYGKVALTTVRSVAGHLGSEDWTYRILDREGVDLGPVYRPELNDPSIPIPDNYAGLVDVAERLSSAVRRAFIRVDLYDIGGRVVFGELTPRPGGPLIFGGDIDERMGLLWEDAHVRLLNDVINGADYTLQFGPEPRELLVGGSPYLPD